MSTPSHQVSQDEAEIRALVVQANTYQNDPERFLALHTEQTVIVNLAGRRVLGRAALATAMAEALGSHLRQVITHSEVTDIQFLTADTALVSCVKHVDDRNEEASSSSLPTAASLTYVVIRQDDAWRIALAQTTPRL